MMSLVAYDQSDDSNEEDAEEDNLSLQPKTSTEIPIATSQKRKESVKITIPSLKEFEDEECPVVPKRPKTQSTSGLFSMLPPPKNTSTLNKPGFVPYVLSSKKAPAPPVPSKPEMKAIKKETPKITAPDILEEHNSDEEVSNVNDSSDISHDTPSIDFFSLDSVKTENKFISKDYLQQDLHTDRPIFAVQSDSSIQNLTFSEPLASTTSSDVQQPLINEPAGTSYAELDSLTNYGSSSVEVYSAVPVPDSNGHYSTDPVTEPDLRETLLKDKEFLKLQGRRREFEAVDIIDVNANDQLTGKNEWLMKSLTEESTHRPSRKKCNMPTQQQKRKHQITYLAFQAKEREMDLKNQWAMNSRTRRETQAKYGF